MIYLVLKYYFNLVKEIDHAKLNSNMNMKFNFIKTCQRDSYFLNKMVFIDRNHFVQKVLIEKKNYFYLTVCCFLVT